MHSAAACQHLLGHRAVTVRVHDLRVRVDGMMRTCLVVACGGAHFPRSASHALLAIIVQALTLVLTQELRHLPCWRVLKSCNMLLILELAVASARQKTVTR